MRQSDDKKRIIREVIDGQQRVSAVLDFVNGKYALSKSLDGSHAGKKFDDLSETAQNSIVEYPFICEVFHGLLDPEVLEIFARLNTYSVKLNAQELRNGRFFGPFKQTAYRLAYEHVGFWERHAIFTDRMMARMKEVELTSELVVLLIDGPQDKKKSLDDFYQRFDRDFPERDTVVKRFRGVVDEIEDSVGEDLSNTDFRRTPLFYTLFQVVAHRVYGVPNVNEPGGGRGKLRRDERELLRDAMLDLAENVALARSGESVPEAYEPFVNAAISQTDNIRPRNTRFQVMFDLAFKM